MSPITECVTESVERVSLYLSRPPDKSEGGKIKHSDPLFSLTLLPRKGLVGLIDLDLVNYASRSRREAQSLQIIVLLFVPSPENTVGKKLERLSHAKRRFFF